MKTTPMQRGQSWAFNVHWKFTWKLKIEQQIKMKNREKINFFNIGQI